MSRQEELEWQPLGSRVIIKQIKGGFVKTESGLITDTSMEQRASKNNFVRAELISIGTTCELFKESSIGAIVLVHEISGAPMAGIAEEYKLMHESDIYAFSKTAKVEDFIDVNAELQKSSHLNISRE